MWMKSCSNRILQEAAWCVRRNKEELGGRVGHGFMKDLIANTPQ
jgi:hypothetical protein